MISLLVPIHLLILTTTVLADYKNFQDIKLPISSNIEIYKTQKAITTCRSRGANLYFDTSSLQCQVCGSNQEGDRSNTNAYGDPVSCTCKGGFSKYYRDCSTVCLLSYELFPTLIY